MRHKETAKLINTWPKEIEIMPEIEYFMNHEQHALTVATLDAPAKMLQQHSNSHDQQL